MRQPAIFSIGCLMILCSCTNKISTSTSISDDYYSPLESRKEVIVYGLQDPIPSNSKEIGVVKIRDTEFSTNDSWNAVIDQAKLEARKTGGNAIKISVIDVSGRRMVAKILKVKNFENIKNAVSVDSSLSNVDYALLYVYRRYRLYGRFISFDLHLGDTVICRVGNECKETIKIRKDGLNSLCAQTEVKQELPINIKFGNEYYVRCGIKSGLLVGWPKLELVENQTGKAEFKSIKLKKSGKKEFIVFE
jgi:hypothetical protein